MLADILDSSGHYILDQMLLGKPNTTFASGYNWPNQGTPTKKEWAVWRLPTSHPRRQHREIPTTIGPMAPTMGQTPPPMELACG